MVLDISRALEWRDSEEMMAAMKCGEIKTTNFICGLQHGIELAEDLVQLLPSYISQHIQPTPGGEDEGEDEGRMRERTGEQV